MIRNHYRYVIPLMPLTPELGDPFLWIEQRLHGRGTKGADGSGLYRHELAEQELSARLHLIRKGRTVFRGAAFHDVADIDLRARERNALFRRGIVNHLGQQLT